MVDHIDIEEGIHQVPKGNPGIIQEIEQKIHCLPPLPPEPCIFKVPAGLRNVNEKAYTPMVVSIGPYHHGNSDLAAMENHKHRYLHSLLEHRKESVEHYFLAMEKLADEALRCYADPILIKRDKFIQLMLLDACFVVEFLRKSRKRDLIDKDDPIFNNWWMWMQIQRDMLLLENQLPFFVLQEFFHMTGDASTTVNELSECMSFSSLAIICSFFGPYRTDTVMRSIIERKRLGHLIDFVHKVYCPDPSDITLFDFVCEIHFQNPYKGNSHFQKLSSFSRNCCFRKLLSSNRDSYFEKLFSLGRNSVPQKDFCSETVDPFEHIIPSAAELEEAGVNLEVHEGEKVSVFHITFENGHMKIPPFSVKESTEIFLRNMIAYEQYSSNVRFRFFTSYTYFLDKLINTEKDVKILRQRRIIQNLLGDDEKVSRMINQLCDGTDERIINSTKYYYSEVSRNVNTHCEKCWNKAKAKLRRDYCYSPWATVSTITAIILVLFALTETIVTLIGVASSWYK